MGWMACVRCLSKTDLALLAACSRFSQDQQKRGKKSEWSPGIELRSSAKLAVKGSGRSGLSLVYNLVAEKGENTHTSRCISN